MNRLPVLVVGGSMRVSDGEAYGCVGGSFAVLLRHYRGAIGLTQEELAERSGLTANAISMLERGIRKAPRATTIEFLAQALKLGERDKAKLLAAALERTEPAEVSGNGVPDAARPSGPEEQPGVGIGEDTTASISPKKIDQQEPGRGPSRLKIVLMLAVVCAMALSAGADSPSVDTGPVCTTGSSGGNTLTCFSIAHSGSFVSSMHASATVEKYGRPLQLCLHGPDPVLQRCTSFAPIQAGDVQSLTWPPDRDVTSGTYCARTWRLNRNRSHTMIGEVCFSVHP